MIVKMHETLNRTKILAKPYLRPIKRNIVRMLSRITGNKHVFDQIYREGRWGGDDGDVFSGSGSTGEAADLYVKAVSEIISKHKSPTIVDIGCGDFRIGSQVAAVAAKYIGIDVSQVAIERNKKKFERPGISFVRLDASKEPLPDGDICLIRQVLQHLPNRDVYKIVEQAIYKYAVVIVTEHYPADIHFERPNVDKPAGSDIRLDDGSAVYLEEFPFKFRTSTLLEVPLSAEKSFRSCPTEDPATWERLRTFVVRR